MFANITVVEAVSAILAVVAGLVAFIKGCEYLIQKSGKVFSKAVEENLKPVNERIDTLIKEVRSVEDQAYNADLNSCKNFLVRFLADIEQDQPVDEVERMRFWETYHRYTVELGQNSYIKEKVANLKAQSKL